MAEDMPKRCACPYCSADQVPYGVWVFEHWDEHLVGTCSHCGKEYAWCRGKVAKMKQMRK
jgi:hypothetical protein